MSRAVVLDSGPLGLLSNPRSTDATHRARLWLEALYEAGDRVIVPEIADYEVRRELIRAGRARGLARLDHLNGLLDYEPLTTQAMRQAASFWAEVRNRGRPTASDTSLDADAILAAQALASARPGESLVVATTNVAHIARFVAAQLWQEIL